MKGFALLLGALAGAALLYVTTAVGGQQAGPSRAEFNALKKQVAVLKKDDLAVQAVLNGCFSSAIPVVRYNGYESRADDGSTFVTTALDVAEAGDTPMMYLLDVGQGCATVINTAKLGLHLKSMHPAATRR
ncbi:MAG: hypothetical protein H0W90_02960 [Actinobacteria bacterium]|nr:hypothetical protein [Actinomycetota bacterium]